MKRFIFTIALLTLIAFSAAGASHHVYSYTSAVAVSASCSSRDTIRVKQVAIHFSAAPTTSENLVFTIDSSKGAAYDTILYTVDPSVSSMTDLFWTPDDDSLILLYGDTLDITFTNTDTGTIGITVYYESVL